jgi:hypothetical protein
MQSKPFGSCCTELMDAIRIPPHSLLRIEENGVLYLTIGYAETDAGVGWFDQAVLFCPFCGTQLQEREQIRRKAFETT